MVNAFIYVSKIAHYDNLEKRKHMQGNLFSDLYLIFTL